jgi:CMP/dCMP kinase
MIIAVDGPSASGKGTLAKALAAHFGFHYLDTGTLYRMVGLMMLRGGHDLADADAATRYAATLQPDTFKDHELRGEAVGSAASKVAAIPAVRAVLLDVQRAFAARQPGAVLDGRDIGTVICPEADVKLFVTADPQVRASRRHAEVQRHGSDVSLAQVSLEIAARDARDAARTLIAPDATVIDTSNMTASQAFDAALKAVSGTSIP